MSDCLKNVCLIPSENNILHIGSLLVQYTANTFLNPFFYIQGSFVAITMHHFIFDTLL